ncbi:hypothetical protein BWX42_04930 [Dolosigranulum pigrum]|uniref:ABC transporter domain-containing protein n=1 Tax=Dolosigranulum pigrum TaxID=29394 RepID=A0A1S8KN74_9LACT|nr:hypothetical protein BWX42_04930 [Dolosigranulum pigrum]
MSIIQFNQVSYAVYEQPLFESVNLTIEATDRIGIVGQNGVGKSTFLKLIAGEEIPDSGNDTKLMMQRFICINKQLILTHTKRLGNF